MEHIPRRMMLYVNGSDIGRIVLGAIADDRGSFVIPLEACAVRPEEFLFTIDAWMTNHGIAKAAVTGVVAVIGPGSATALRTSIAFANTFAFAQSLPLYGVPFAVGVDDRSVLVDLLSVQPSPMLVPVYANAPTITVSKKDALRRTL